MKGKGSDSSGGVVAVNRRARHDYHLEGVVEAGIALTGSEVRSLRRGQVSLMESYAEEQGGEIFLLNAYIAPWPYASPEANHAPRRRRRLLLSRREIRRLAGAVVKRGRTLVPLDVHFNGRGYAKLDLALATGKRAYDKRAAERDKEWRRARGNLMRVAR